MQVCSLHVGAPEGHIDDDGLLLITLLGTSYHLHPSDYVRHTAATSIIQDLDAFDAGQRSHTYILPCMQVCLQVGMYVCMYVCMQEERKEGRKEKDRGVGRQVSRQVGREGGRHVRMQVYGMMLNNDGGRQINDDDDNEDNDDESNMMARKRCIYLQVYMVVVPLSYILYIFLLYNILFIYLLDETSSLVSSRLVSVNLCTQLHTYAYPCIIPPPPSCLHTKRQVGSLSQL